MDSFHSILQNWFKHYKRDLPWRLNPNPYLVWISEIILQQTRVDQGLSYYLRFIGKFPDIQSLAEASEEEVLLLWQGLGYYSRARNLHAAAQQILKDHNGVFPSSYEKIRNLRGVGPYTAAAIASISFGLPFAVLDGNVYRVLSRKFGISTPIDSISGRKEFTRLAEALLDKENPGTYNEALMDFGALQCKPKKPVCSACPFETSCTAYQTNQVEQLPVKSKRMVQRNRYLIYLLIKYNNSFYLQKRKAKDIWRNLYQLPLIELSDNLEDQTLFSSADFRKLFKDKDPVIESFSPAMIHRLSHQILNIRFIKISIQKALNEKVLQIFLTDQTEKFPFPKPIHDYLKKEFKITV